MLDDVVKSQKSYVDDKYGPIKSLHEGYGLVMEEFEELTKELEGFTRHFKQVWEGIKKDSVDADNFYGKSLDLSIERAHRTIEEAIDLIVVLQRIKEVVRGDMEGCE